MPHLCDINNCTSCQACYNACPFDAIRMKKSELSTLIPEVKADKCRECGLCEISCPIINPQELYAPSKAIALYTRDEYDKASCSSGGAATVFTKHVISAGGIVYGTTSLGGLPKFIRVDTEEQIESLKGSKYVYCNPGLIYKSVKKDLVSGLRVLFIGLPCNVAALRGFLKKDYENLITVDLVCHGTPPTEYLIRHLEDKLGNNAQTVNNITFRGKNDYFLTVYDDKCNVIYSKSQYEDEYFQAFMHAVFNKPACYSCQYARQERVSDMTIGDFWGIDKTALNNYKGKISLALLNTQRGEKLFNQCKQDIEWEERQVNEAIAGNPQLRHPAIITSKSEKFRLQYEKSHKILKAFIDCGIKQLTIRNKIRKILLYLPKKILKFR